MRRWLGVFFGDKGAEPVDIFSDKEKDVSAADPFSGSGVQGLGSFGNAIGAVNQNPQHGLLQSMGVAQSQQNALSQQYASLANQMSGNPWQANIDPGHSHQVFPTATRKVDPSWGVNITKVENGFMVVVTDNQNGTSTRYIAADVEAVTDMIAVGLVTARLEA